MASESDNKGKCFTIIWKLENASYWWKKDQLISPSFTVDEIGKTKWILSLLDLSVVERYFIGFFLNRQENNERAESIAIDCELAFLSSDGTVLHSWERKHAAITNNVRNGTASFAWRSEVFSERRSVFLPQDTLTARCRIWKSVGEMSKHVECFARTRIAVEKRSFLWNIEDFRDLKPHGKETYEIKSLMNGEQLLSLELFLTGGIIYDERIRFKIIQNFQNVKISTFELSIVDASKNTVKCFQDEFWHADACDTKYFTLVYTKNDLMEKESLYLPEDALSLSCEYAFSYGNVENEIETANIDCTIIEKKESDKRSSDKEAELPVPKGILINDFKSMLNDSIHSDIKLKTNSHTYPAHKCILSVRSPVFKAMFSSDMKEKITDCVDIEDLNDDTVLRMLRYIYSADVEELEWVSATELYEAADKYQILNLKDICSSYLKSNLAVNNACEALVLFDLHQDEDMKGFVQDFIMRHGKDIINSEEWEQVAETNLKLAYETLRLKFKE